jgi:hypothetical protein
MRRKKTQENQREKMQERGMNGNKNHFERERCRRRKGNRRERDAREQRIPQQQERSIRKDTQQ